MKDKLLDKIIRFDKLLGLTALTIAFVAAFFSVFGISLLFSGAFLSTCIMASSLEIGKLVTVTFLYRYWQKAKGFLKTYLTIAVVVLMLITSLGIFGYLSHAYQKSSLEFKANQDKIGLVESQKTYVNDRISQSQERIKVLNEMRKAQETRLNGALTNMYLSRNALQLKQLQQQTIDLINQADNDIKLENDKIQKSTDELQSIDNKVNELKTVGNSKKDIQTFQFVANEFGTSLDKVAKWFILTLIFVFDPLAVALILAYNVIVYKKEEGFVTSIDDINPKQGETPLENMVTPESPQPVVNQPVIKSEIKENVINSSNENEIKVIEHPPLNPNYDPFYRGYFKK